MKRVFLLMAACLAALPGGLPAVAQQVAPTDLTGLHAGAEAGDADAQLGLARIYMDGRGVAPDDFEAVRWLRMAAEQRHPVATLELGWMLANGFGAVQDFDAAFYWFARAAALGAEGAADQRDALGQRIDPAKRARLMEEAVADLPDRRVDVPSALSGAGDPVLRPTDTYADLRDRLNQGGGPEDLTKLLLLARDGDALARNLAGLILRRSQAPEDRQAGLDWLRAAARQGLPAAQYNLAAALLQDGAPGRGQLADVQAVRRWLDVAETGITAADEGAYDAVRREFNARAGITDPYRAAEQGSPAAFRELAELIRLKRIELEAYRDMVWRRGGAAQGGVSSGSVETTVIE